MPIWAPWQAGARYTGSTTIPNGAAFLVQNWPNRATTVEELSTTQFGPESAFTPVWNNTTLSPASGFQIFTNASGPPITSGRLSQAWFLDGLSLPQSSLLPPSGAAYYDESFNLMDPHPIGSNFTLNYQWKYASDIIGGTETFDIYTPQGLFTGPGAIIRSQLTNTDPDVAPVWTLIGQITASIPAGTPAGVNGYLSPDWTTGSLDVEIARASNVSVYPINEDFSVFPPVLASVGPLNYEWFFVVVPHREITGGELGTSATRLLWFQPTSIDYTVQMPNYRWGYPDTPVWGLDGDLTDARVRFSATN